jgi:hypothetical protein
MTVTLAAVKVQALSLGASFQSCYSGRCRTAYIDAPKHYVWVSNHSHCLIHDYRPGSTHEALLSSLAKGLEPCPFPRCFHCNH